MMTRLRQAMKKMGERRHERSVYWSTAHLDSWILKDMGITRDDWNRTANRYR